MLFLVIFSILSLSRDLSPLIAILISLLDLTTVPLSSAVFFLFCSNSLFTGGKFSSYETLILPYLGVVSTYRIIVNKS